MAFIQKNLFKVENLQFGRTLYNYWTTDATGVVDTTGYFDTETNLTQLRVGDLILRHTVSALPVAATDSITVSSIGWHVVLSNNGTTINVSDTTVIAVADAD